MRCVHVSDVDDAKIGAPQSLFLNCTSIGKLTKNWSEFQMMLTGRASSYAISTCIFMDLNFLPLFRGQNRNTLTEQISRMSCSFKSQKKKVWPEQVGQMTGDIELRGLPLPVFCVAASHSLIYTCLFSIYFLWTLSRIFTQRLVGFVDPWEWV